MKLKFIVDGPDCTGKSTLCSQLSKTFNIPVFHLTYFKDDCAMVNQFNDGLTLIRGDKGCVLDRYIFSNIAYGNVYHNGTYVSGHTNYTNGEDLFRTQIIFSLPKSKERYLEFFKSKYADREEMYSLDEAGKVYDEYAALYETYSKKEGLSVLRYDMFDYIDNPPKSYERTEKGWENS